MPPYFGFGTDFLLAVRYAKVINNQECGKNGFTVAVTSVLSPSILLALIILPAPGADQTVGEYLCILFFNQYFSCVVPEI